MVQVQYKASRYTVCVVLFCIVMLVMGNNKAYMYSTFPCIPKKFHSSDCLFKAIAMYV